MAQPTAPQLPNGMQTGASNLAPSIPPDTANVTDPFASLGEQMMGLGAGEAKPIEIEIEPDMSFDSPFYENLIDELDEHELYLEASKLQQAIEDDKSSRSDYDKNLKRGIIELGFDPNSTTGEPTTGASTVRVPMLAKAAISFQARVKRELFPPSGAARGVTFSKNADDEAIRERVEIYTNHMISRGMQGYSEGMDSALFMLAFYGSLFRKVHWNGYQVGVSTIKPWDFIVPWSTKSLFDCPRITHVLRLHAHEVRENFRLGLWKKVPLIAGEDGYDTNDAQWSMDRVVGLTRGSSGSEEDERYVIYECYTYLNLERDDEDDPKPYIITFDATSSTVLAVRRNWEEHDEYFRPRQFFTHWKFLPWDGFYGIGLCQVMGDINIAASGSLRALMDAAHAQNSPGGLADKKAITSGQYGDNQMVTSPFAWTPVNIPNDSRDRDIRKHFMPNSQLYEPSAVLLQLLQMLIQMGDDFGNISVTDMMSADKQAPVGTALALIEQQGIIYSGIHARQHAALARELELFRQRNAEHLGGDDMVSSEITILGEITVAREDFQGLVEIVPASDPSIFSSAQRIAQAQAAFQLVQQAQQLGVEVDIRDAFIKYAQAMGFRDTSKMFPEPKPEQPPAPMDPAAEMIAIMGDKPVQAAQGQNHQAHIDFLSAVRNDPFYSKHISTKIGALDALIFGHVGLMIQESVLGAMAQQGINLPPAEAMAQVPPEVSGAIAARMAQTAQQLAATRPAPEGDVQDKAAAALQADVERKAQLDAQNAQIRVAEIQQRDQQANADRASREQIESAKLSLKQQEMQQDSGVVAAQVNSTNQQNMARISNDRDVNLAKLNNKLQETMAINDSNERIEAANIASDNRMEAEKLASKEAQVSATLASKEQIAAAQISAEQEQQRVDMVDRRLGEIQKINSGNNS